MLLLLELSIWIELHSFMWNHSVYIYIYTYIYINYISITYYMLGATQFDIASLGAFWGDASDRLKKSQHRHVDATVIWLKTLGIDAVI